MVKYGKKLRKSMIQEWQKEYFAYKIMKKMIKEFVTKDIDMNKTKEDFIFQINPEKTETENDFTIITNDLPIQSQYGDSISNLKQSLETLYDKPQGYFLKNFLEKMNMEIRKFYLFYCTIERELYLQINTLLHRRYNYSNFHLEEIYKELDNLVKVAYITKVFCLYINDNMVAIKKILKKFDKNFKKYYGPVTIKYLKALLEQPNSDFNYMLQYKIIDEVSALVEDMMKDLIKVFNIIKNQRSTKRTPNNNNDNSSTVNDLLIIPDNRSESSSIYICENIKENKDLINNINYKIKELKNYTCRIDEINTFRTKIKDWNFYIRNGYSIINNHIKLLHREAQRSMMIGNAEDEEVIKKFLTNSDKSKAVKDEMLSIENRTNIIISLLHTFIYMSIYSVCHSTNSAYLDTIHTGGIYSGLIMGLTPLAAIISTIVLSKWSNYSYKKPMIISLFLILIGSFLYGFAYNFSSPFLIGSGRFITGLGAGRTVNRRYLIQFIPKNLITKYSLYYVLAGMLGLAFGPAFSYLFVYFKEYNNIFDLFSFNAYTYPGWYGFIISFLLLSLLIFFYTEPYSSSFKMFENDKEPLNVITKEEKVMINEIDNKLDQINQENQFSDTNLVQSNLEIIKSKQKSNFSYIYKCFIIIFITLFSVRFCNESLLIIFPYYLLKHNYSINFISLFLSGTLFLVVPTFFFIKKISLRDPGERKILIYLLIIVFFATILIINIIYESILKFCVCMVIIILVSNLIESLSSSLLAKIIPPDWEMGTFNTGFLITISTTTGKSLGSFIQTIFGLILGPEYIIVATYGLSAFLFLMIIFLFFKNYSDLRVKALARILKSQTFSKI